MLEKCNSWIVKFYVWQDSIQQNMRKTLANQKGAGAVEYGLVIAVVVVMVVLATTVMRDPLEKFFAAVVAKVRGLF